MEGGRKEGRREGGREGREGRCSFFSLVRKEKRERG